MVNKPDPNCEFCGGDGFIVNDEYSPLEYYGHREVTTKCVCVTEKEPIDEYEGE